MRCSAIGSSRGWLSPTIVRFVRAASFYPALGPYSSKDSKVISEHMNQLRQAGVGVLAVSWYSPNRADPNVRKVTAHACL